MSDDEDEGAAELNPPDKFTPRDWVELLQEYGNGPGHADVALLGRDPKRVRSTSLALLGLSMTTPRFRSVVFISPPTLAGGVDIVASVRGVLTANGHPQAHAERITLHSMPTLESRDVVNTCRECGDDALIYIEAAGGFRYADEPAAHDAVATEDEWVPHVVRLAKEIAADIASGSYALLDVGHVPPIRAANKTSLEQIPGSVICMEVAEKAARIANAILDAQNADPATLAAALGEIGDAPGLATKAAAMLQAIALHGAERYVGAWNVLSAVWDEWLDTADDSTSLQLARIAADADMSANARGALAKFSIDEAPVDLLELALHVARRCDARDIEEGVLNRLRTVDPGSVAVAAHLINRSMRDQDWARLREIAQDRGLAIEADERVYLTDLAAALAGAAEDLVYAAARLSEAHPLRAGSLRILIGREAARRGRYSDAVVQFIAVSRDSNDAPRAASLTIDTLEAVLLLRNDERGFAIPDTTLVQIIAFVAQQVARVPRNARLRSRFSQLLSAEVLGTRGEAILSFLIENLLSAPIIKEAPSVPNATLAEAQSFLEVVARMVEAADRKTPFVVGLGRLPESIGAEEATRLLSILPDAVRHMVRDLPDERSVEAARRVLHGALLACERAGARRIGVMLLRRVAVSFAIAGWSQHARDLAEHCLCLVGPDREELRLAWATFADVYQRLGTLHDALIAMLLASSFPDVGLAIEEAWQEGFLVVRLLRDLGLCAEAEAMLRAAETVVADTEVKRARMDSIRLTIEMRRLDRDRTSSPHPLIDRLVTNVRQLIAVEDDVTPPLVALMQLVARARNAGDDVSPDVDQVIDEALQRVAPTSRARIEAFGAARPSIATVRSLVTRLGSVRFADDIGYDIQPAAVVAQRALLHSDDLDAFDALELMELLADRTLVEHSREVNVASIKQGLTYLIERGQSVHVLALDEGNTLVRATIQRDATPKITRETAEVFSPERFERWKELYPYQYAFMDDPDSVMADAVRRSVDQVGISGEALGPAVVIPDVRLQRFPMNLLRRDRDFSGELYPIATAPSLEWVAAVALHPRSPNGRRIAWISDALPEGDNAPALGPLADRLEPIANDHGVLFSRSRKIPSELAGADLVILTAHGGLLPERRFFQVVSDDAEEHWSPRDIARAVADAGVVVLFVCSAGRHDEHPRARATVGLARMLLANGVRAVVASPWPLDTRVPPRWLPSFLTSLDGGYCVTDAAFLGNASVAHAFGGNPPHAYAMHVYGDPTHRP